MASNSFQFTETAKRDLDEILRYIRVDLANQGSARAFFKAFFSRIDDVCAFPESCETVDNELLKRKDVRKMIVGNYLAYYVFEKEKRMLTILRIVYGKRNLEEIIKLL